MKLVKSTDDEMRDDFAFLMQTEEGDNAVATTDGSVTRFKRFPTGTYLIELFANRTGAQKFYYPCTESFAKKLMGMDASEAYDAMNRYVFA